MTTSRFALTIGLLLLPAALCSQSSQPVVRTVPDTSAKVSDSTRSLSLSINAPSILDIVRYNRVEGLYTGIGVRLATRDTINGVLIRGIAGRSWAEHTERGRVTVDRIQGDWSAGIRAGRSLDITNDFRSPRDSGSIFGIGSEDAYDYVDRRFAGIELEHRWVAQHTLLRGELGYADDRYAANSLQHGIFSNDNFLPNHGVHAGGYRRSAAVLEWGSDYNIRSNKPGFSSRLMYERGDGTLTYQRAELRVLARSTIGPFLWLARGNAGQTFGRDILPQQLFELGRGQNLPGYDNKEFAGSRAAVLRTTLLYKIRIFDQPIRISERTSIPALSPSVSMGLQSGWADAQSSAARNAVEELGTRVDSLGIIRSLSTVTGKVRYTASAGLRLYSERVYIGLARAIGQTRPWQFHFSLETTI